MTDTLFIRLLHHEDKGAALVERTAALREGRADGDIYTVNPDSFRQVPNTPFCYWVSDRIRRLFGELSPFESEGRTVKQGLATADDFRFVRAWWEVPGERVLDGGRWPVVGGQSGEDREEKWTEERIREFQAWCRQRTYEGKRWVPFAKGGEYSPYYADIHLVVNWEKEGAEIKNNLNDKGGVRSNVWMLRDTAAIYFFRPGLTWPLRANRFAPQVMPSGSIFSVRGYAAFPEPGDEMSTLAVFNSSAFDFIFKTALGRFGFPEFIVGILQILPWQSWSLKQRERFENLGECSAGLKSLIDCSEDTSHAFTLPALLQTEGATLAERAAGYAKRAADTDAELRKIQAEIDEIAFDLYRFTEEERQAVVSGPGSGMSEGKTEGQESAEGDEDAEALNSDNRPLTTARYIVDLLSWCVGVAFGRCDIRLALDPSLVPGAPDPFEPLPVCPPGMLIGPDGLPAEPDRIVSEEWLRARPDASTLPPDGSVSRPTIPDSKYPLRISWDGILVDDPGLDGSQPHRDDIVRRVREVLELLWKGKAHEFEQEACGILGVRDLRDYFRKPTGFFQDHLRRYSKSRRKAPIYWPLSTASGSYTIWIYYHRLTEDTLYRIVSDYVSPKIGQVEDRITQREAEHRSAQGRDAARLAKKLSELTSLLQELKELRDELLRVAHLPYRPNLNDGVQITAAPLWRLFRLPRWRAELERTWRALEHGDYDWAHLAYAIWPERVREACRRNRSIAIAHGLEELYEERSAPERPARRRRGQAG